MSHSLSKHQAELKQKILNVAAKNFLKHGFTSTTVKMITSEVGISTGSFNHIFQTKEDVLCDLVKYVLETQFSVADSIIDGKTKDKLLLYTVETVLQLHIVEMNENLRDVYCNAYSLSKPSAIIQQTITKKLEYIFKEHLPQYETKDFYKLEIASGGIMRGFMTIPCDMWFTMDQKVEAFLETTFLIYRVDEAKIQEAIKFTKQFDFKKLAEETINTILKYLEDY